MAQLGVFLIPPPEHPFYALCSGILGYDVWAGRQSTSTLAAYLDDEMVTRWLGPAASVGAHCTLSGVALTYDAADVNEVRERLAWIASRTPPFSLVNGRFLDDERARPWALLAELDSTDGEIHRLHRQVATIINPLRVGSLWAPGIPGLSDRPRELYLRTGEPWTLELYVPHWTLFTALPDAETRATVRDLISDRLGLFADERTRTLDIADVHLVERPDNGSCTVIGSFPLTGACSASGMLPSDGGSMVQLGVFLIPSAEHPFYRVVSDILGYDVLARRQVDSSLAGHLDPTTLPQWLGRAPEFGTHCTITGGDIVYDEADLDEVKARLAWIAGRTRPFSLVNGRFYDDFHATPMALVTRFDSPDGAIGRLHRLAATMISPLHVDTTCRPPRDPNDARAREIYIRTGEAWALERFAPHWTLMSGLPDMAAWEAARDLIRCRTDLFADDRTRTLDIADVHLVRREEHGDVRVAASFPLTGR